MFYADLNARDFDGAWNLLSPQYQRTLDFDTWVSGYRTTESVTLSSVSVTAQSEAHATVDVFVTATDNTENGEQMTQ